MSFESNPKQHAQFVLRLKQGVQALGFSLESAQITRLLEYLYIFEKWNKTYNLSSIRVLDEMLNKHLLDSLSIVPFLSDKQTGSRFIDVGTGGGLPGVVLAICFPERHFTLLDSVGKKTRFLFQVKQSLSLDNVAIENIRVEHFQPAELYDGVITRAYSTLAHMTGGCSHLLREGGKFWAMKGVIPKDELREIEKHYIVESCHEIAVPGDDSERCLIVFNQN
ncbi:MAG: 16S rRNA (guanine(527)-N(7))-methyltransferase RsmG [Alteromonadaceae bacterium]|nr:MAG: 16S rRNA (guanine(527)-N(7))-methyltransferase RsmG [Alteromonadaceae bacterium]